MQISNTTLRTCGSKETYEKICEAFRPVKAEIALLFMVQITTKD